MTSGDTKASGLRPTRRTVVKGAAWAVPAVMVASAAPAFAQSGPVIVVPGTGVGAACRHTQGDSLYHFVFCFSNTTEDTAEITITKYEISKDASGFKETTFSYPPPTAQGDVYFEVPSGETWCVAFDGPDPDGSSIGNGSARISYTWVAGALSDSGTSINSTTDNDLPVCHSQAGVPSPPHPVPLT